MLPADQFGDGDLVAVRFQLQAAQDVGQLAAELAGVQWVPPEFGQRVGQRCAFVLFEDAGDFGLAAGHQDDEFGVLFEGDD